MSESDENRAPPLRPDASPRHWARLPAPARKPGLDVFWFNFGHPYLVRRLVELTNRHPAVFEI